MYWILDIEGEVHTIWDLWISGLQECKGNGFFFLNLFFKSGKTCISYQSGLWARILAHIKFKPLN